MERAEVMSSPKRFRQLIADPEILVLPGAWDGLSGLLIEQAGFQGVYVTGGGIARSSGVPDIGLITMSEQVARVKMICDAVSVPVLADADTGYGNAINLMRAVRDMEAAGAAGIHIEDQITPKRCGHYEGKEVVDRQEYLKKIEAACAVRQHEDFVIIARTDARAVLGLDEAILRGQESVRVGADVIFIEAPQTVDEIKRIADTIDAPLLINMVTKGGKTPFVSTDELEPTLTGDLKLRDVEDDDLAEITVTRALINRYKQTVRAYCQSLKDYCGRRGVNYIFATPEVDVDQLVLKFLRRRGLVK